MGEEAMAILTLGALFSLLVLASADPGPVLRLPVEAASVEVSAGPREFDYFALALQWPGTYCLRTHHCCPKNGCCRSSPLVDFTIHGLWPDYNDGSWPSCCSSSEFDINKISSLMPTMEKYWPSLSCGSTTLCDGGKGLFWAHEWGKHGTCSYPVIKDEYSYFSTALELYFKSNITGVLSNAGFLASNAEKYPLGDIIATIEKAMGASPLLVCKHGSIEELRICFYKDFKPRDCIIRSSAVDDTSKLRSSCPRYISLPTYAAPIVPEDISAASTWAGGITFEPLTQIMKSLWNWS